MKILLLGEYSRLHNSLKEGLIAIGHEVVIVSDGDGFKNYPSDYSIAPVVSNSKLMKLIRRGIHRIFKHDIAKTERGLRFYLLMRKLLGFDVVQLINEAPVKTIPAFEKYLLKRVFSNNNKVFLLSCGIDYISVQYMLDRKLKYSLMDPYFANPALSNRYEYIFDYTTKAHKKLHNFVLENCSGIIASDMDYVLPLQNHPKFLGLIPNPVNLTKFNYALPEITGKIVIFLGINRYNYLQKGIPFFEQALQIISNKYTDKVEIIITENIPYNEYITLFDKGHIILDQVYGYDQGYNALEAMAKGKVVFTGAEDEFMEYYNLTKRVAMNALPDVNVIVQELSFLIENPDEIVAISMRARAFIEKHHDYINVAGKYLTKWI